MPEVIMEYDLDETGKMINLVRKEEVVRCKECAHRDTDGECDQYDDGTVAVSCKVPDDHYCKYGEQKKHDDIVDSNRFCCDTWMGFRSCMRSIVHQMAPEPNR